MHIFVVVRQRRSNKSICAIKNTLKKDLLIPRKTILSKVKELALQISSDYAGKEPIFVGILNGVVFFFADLVMGTLITDAVVPAVTPPTAREKARQYSRYGKALREAGGEPKKSEEHATVA